MLGSGATSFFASHRFRDGLPKPRADLLCLSAAFPHRISVHDPADYRSGAQPVSSAR